MIKHEIGAIYQRFLELRNQLPSDNQIYMQMCREFDYQDVSSLRKRIIKHMGGNTGGGMMRDTPSNSIHGGNKRTKVPLPAPDTYVYRGQRPLDAIPIFSGAEELELDECMVTGDLHLPSTKFWFLDRMCRVADQNMGSQRTLLIIGDMINGDKDSVHPKNYPMPSRETEFRLAEQTIDFLLGFFDEIVFTPGNHFRNRLFSTLDGDIDMDRALRLLTPHTDRVFMSAYDYIYVKSGTERWTMCHQYSYSPNKLVKANELAQKYQSNICCFHQHHTAIGRDRYDRYTVVDVGGHHDQSQMGYVNLVPNTMPAMNSGFVFLRNGVAHLLSPYSSFTDWSMWITDKDLAETTPS